MKVLVTGATGFVGSHLAEQLINQNHQVFCLVRPTSNRRWLKHLPLNYILDRELKEVVADMDYIYHLAGVIKAYSFEDYYRGNVQLTKDLIEAVTEAKPARLKRFLHLSSLAASGPAGSVSGINEETSCHPITDYGKTKLEAEEVLRNYFERVPITILRPPPVYGPRDEGLLVYFQAVSYGLLPRFNPRRYVSIIYVRDLVNEMLKAAQHPRCSGGTYFVANQKPYALNALSDIIKDAVCNGRGVCPVPLPDILIRNLGAVFEAVADLRGQVTIFNRQKALELTQNYWVCRTDKARKDWGLTTETPLEKGIKETAEWYRRNKWL